MKPFGKEFYLKKKVLQENQKNSEKIYKQNIQFIHKLVDTINISLLVLIFLLFFLSFDSQRKWSNTYQTLLKTKAINYNLIDFISKVEGYYIAELESFNSYKKTKPKDLIYIDKILEKKEGFFKKNFRSFLTGFSDSKYQVGY